MHTGTTRGGLETTNRWANEMAELVKVSAAKPDELSSVLRTLPGGIENRFSPVTL